MFEQMRFGQGFKHTQNLGTFLQCAACQLTDNKRLAKDLLIKERSFQTFATRLEMLNPNQRSTRIMQGCEGAVFESGEAASRFLRDLPNGGRSP